MYFKSGRKFGGVSVFLAVIWLVLILSIPARAASALLWSVKDKEGHQIYLMGSLHLATPDMYPLNQVILDAFGRSKRLVVEVDINSLDEVKMAQKMAALGLYNDGSNLLDHLKPPTIELLEENQVYKSLPGATRMKPWLMAVTIQALAFQKLGFDEKLGLDRHFIKQARDRGLPVEELETMESQLALFTGMSEVENDLFLRYSLLEVSGIKEVMDELIDLWQTGQAKKFGELFFLAYEEYPELSPLLDRIFIKRNYQMFEKLLPYFRRKGDLVFVVVGSGHLVGPKGLPKLFSDQGFVVEQY